MSNTICALPWIHLATRPNGDVRLCCTANASGAGDVDEKVIGLVKKNGISLNLRNNSLEEIWNSDQMKQTRLTMLRGEIPDSCKKCFVEEANGIVSKRQWETEVWKERLDLSSIIKTTDTDGSLPVNIPYFDLRLGNMCQLKCVMCSPHDSSAWIKDWKIQYPTYKNTELQTDQRWDSSYDYTWYQKGSFLDTMKDQASNIKELYFAGGEPLLIPEHYKILEFMVNSGNATNCILRYNSNGLELPSKLFDLWRHFKSVKFNFSIDNLFEKNDYIRHPSKWNAVLHNLQILDNTDENVTVNIACAVQLLNVLDLVEFVEWKHKQKFKKINVSNGAGMIGLHLVYFPSYLNVRCLPKAIKDIAANRIIKFVESQNNNQEFLNDPMGQNRWLGLVKYMQQEDWSHKIPMLQEYLTSCDITRGTDYRTTFPELKDLL
jgi:MoaA/NifB/PqqE/SkfB family radical SAM enzyme